MKSTRCKIWVGNCECGQIEHTQLDQHKNIRKQENTVYKTNIPRRTKEDAAKMGSTKKSRKFGISVGMNRDEEEQIDP
jgi:hypothetical protein